MDPRDYVQYILVTLSVVTTLALLLNKSLGSLGLIVEISIVFFFVGFSLLYAAGFVYKLDTIEILVLSFHTSYATTGLLAAILILVPHEYKGVIAFGGISFVGMLSLVYNRLISRPRLRRSFTEGGLLEPWDKYILSILLLFHAALLAILYPKLGYLSHSDWSRHFNSASILWRFPKLHWGSYPPLLRLQISFLVGTCDVSIGSISTALAFTGLMWPLTLYSLGRALFQGIRGYEKAPLILSILGEFSGWTSGFRDLLSLLKGVSQYPYEKSFQLTIFPRNQYISVSLTLFVLLLLAKRVRDPERAHDLTSRVLLTVAVAALYLSHIIEACLLSVAFLISYLLTEDAKIRSIFREAIVEFCCGLSLALGVLVLLSLWLPLFSPNPLFVAAGLLSIVLMLVMGVQSKVSLGISRILIKFLKLVHQKQRPIMFLIWFVFLVSLLLWIDVKNEPAIVPEGRIVLLYEYPARLGVPGLLGLVGACLLLRDLEKQPAKTLFLLLVIPPLVFLAGGELIGLSYIVGIFIAGIFPEFRFVRLLKALLLPLASLGLTALAQRSGSKLVNRSSHQISSVRSARRWVPALLLILLISYEALPTTVGSLRWRSVEAASPIEIDAAEFLRDTLNKDPPAHAISTSSSTWAVLTFGGAPFVTIPTSKSWWKLKLIVGESTPEASLYFSYAPPATHPYLVHHRGGTTEAFFDRLASVLSPVYENEWFRIYNLSPHRPVPPESPAVLALPASGNVTPEVFVDVLVGALSHLGLNFTTALDLDPGVVRREVLILPYDPPRGNQVTKAYCADEDDVRGWAPRWSEVVDLRTLPTHFPFMRAVRVTTSIAPWETTNNATIWLQVLPREFRLPRPASVVGIVYGYLGEESYRRAEVVFTMDGKIYAALRSQGDISSSERSRYARVGRWTPGEPVNITLDLRPDGVTLEVNGRAALSVSEDVPRGRVGVTYTPVSSVKLVDVRIVETIPAEWGPHLEAADLLDYVEAGGRAVVFNANGYQSISHMLLSVEQPSRESNSSLIAGEVHHSSPRNVSVDLLRVRGDSTCEPLAYYVTEEGEVPFACVAPFGRGSVYLVNAYPLVDLLHRGGLTRSQLEEVYEVLGDPLLGSGVVRRVDDDYYPELSVAGGLSAENVTASSSSAIFVANASGWIRVEGEGVSMLFENVSAVGIYADGGLNLSSPELEIYSIRRTFASSAFYLPLEVREADEFSLQSRGGASIAVWSGSEELSRQPIPPGVYRVELGGNSSWVVYLRRPTLSASGVFEARDVRRLLSAPAFGVVPGSDLVLNGSVVVRVELSDTWLAFEELEVNGSWAYARPLVSVDFRRILRATLSSILLLAPLFIVATCYMSGPLFGVRREDDQF